MTSTLNRLQNIIGKQLGIEANLIKPEYDFSRELGADSLDIVELVMLIEDEFELDIEDEIVSKITTINDILLYIDEHSKSE